MPRNYTALGDAFTPEAEAGVQRWIDDNPQGKFGRHEYKLAEWGLTEGGIRRSFERYLAEYDVEPEGRRSRRRPRLPKVRLRPRLTFHNGMICIPSGTGGSHGGWLARLGRYFQGQSTSP